jgi:formamidopyrimidine-DNA glycosylase
MPELPEVERARRLVERVGRGRRIVRATAARDRLLFPEGAERTAGALQGRRIVAAHRHGKWMWLELDRAPHVLVHLGMSGAWSAKGEERFAYRSSGKKNDEAWPPRFAKLTIALDDGGELVLSDPRRLGRVVLREDPRGEKPLSELGFDPLLGMPTLAEFRARMARRRGPVKGLILDQTFSAGVGNWVADEVLYQARLDPRTDVTKLSDDEVRRLREKIRSVVKMAVAKDADSARFPKSWLFHHRWEKGTKTAAGEAIAHTVVAGRTTAWVPTVQRKATRR